MSSERKSRVLIVDDNEDMVATLKDLLELSDYEVDVAFDGAGAVERVREFSPDCVLMDIRMPGVNGVEAFREIKRLSRTPYVIFMTGYATSNLVEEARREGALEVLTKPLNIEQTLDLLRETVAETSVLLVDDDPDFCTTLQDALSAQSFRVCIANDLDSALSAFETARGSVVILDMKLNGRCGLEGLAVFKKLNPGVIVILISAFAECQQDMDKGLKCSAYAAFMKPFDVDELVRVIREALAHQTGVV